MAQITKPWFGFLRPEHVQLLEALRPIVGGRILEQVLDLYEEARLVEDGGGEWEMWGDKNEDGTSRGPIPHSVVVAVVNFVMQRHLGLRQDFLQTLAGLVHDAFKRLDVESKDYDATHAKSRQRLAEIFGTDVARLAELSGHGAMPEVLARFNELEVAVAFLVDNMVVGTRIVTAAAKCDMLDHAAVAGRYPYNDEGIVRYGVPYFTMQRYIAVGLEARTAILLKVSPTNQLAEHLRGWVLEDFGVAL